MERRRRGLRALFDFIYMIPSFYTLDGSFKSSLVRKSSIRFNTGPNFSTNSFPSVSNTVSPPKFSTNPFLAGGNCNTTENADDDTHP